MLSLLLDIGAGDGLYSSGRTWMKEHALPMILIVAIAVIIVVAIYFISKYQYEYKHSPEYLEKIKNRPTSKDDLKEIAVKAKLSKEELALLSEIISHHSTPNIKYILKDAQQIEDILKEKYLSLKQNGNADKIKAFFSLRQKIFLNCTQENIIKNSRQLDKDTKFTYTAEKGIHFIFKLIEMTQEGMALEVPENLTEEQFPKNLSKIKLPFISETGNSLEMETRVIRHQPGKAGRNWLIVTHSDKIYQMKKRAFPRLELCEPCKFSAVTEIQGKTKDAPPAYEVHEKRYGANIADISAGGCRLESNLPIKAGQNIYVEGNLHKIPDLKAIGVILRTTKRSDNVFVYHIKFNKISVENENLINEIACGYESTSI